MVEAMLYGIVENARPASPKIGAMQLLLCHADGTAVQAVVSFYYFTDEWG
jgi:hypothetical protein